MWQQRDVVASDVVASDVAEVPVLDHAPVRGTQTNGSKEASVYAMDLHS